MFWEHLSSPSTKVILRNKTKHLKIEIGSAGTVNFHKKKFVDLSSIGAEKMGLIFNTHRARGYCKSNFKEFTYIFKMGEKNPYLFISTRRK